jgi:hypothetical protein
MSEEIEQIQVEKEINLDHDHLIGKCAQWADEESERASDAGKTRQDIGQFLEKTGVNSKALANVRGAMKQKKEADRLDWLRSMEQLLPMAAAHIRGQSTGDMLDSQPPVPVE